MSIDHGCIALCYLPYCVFLDIHRPIHLSVSIFITYLFLSQLIRLSYYINFFSICLFTLMYLLFTFNICIYQSVYPSLSISFAYLYFCQSTFLHVYPSFSLSMPVTVHPFIYLVICFPVSLHVCSGISM